MPPLIIFIFIVIWILTSFKVALIILGIATIISLYFIIKNMYEWNPRRPGFKTEGDIKRENLTK